MDIFMMLFVFYVAVFAMLKYISGPIDATARKYKPWE